MAQNDPYSSFVHRVCAARKALIKSGKSKMPALKCYEDIDALKLWLQFYGHKDIETIKAWFLREQSTIQAVMPPSFKNELETLINDKHD